ncbi:MAG: hypothetical protein LC749_15340 [Actinobacteria bacterium]|nr:hypothetical protein [Actinomycetota bacterium]
MSGLLLEYRYGILLRHPGRRSSCGTPVVASGSDSSEPAGMRSSGKWGYKRALIQAPVIGMPVRGGT